MSKKIYMIKISCKDRPGIIAAMTGFIKDKAGNILDLNHHTEELSRSFFLVCKFTVPQKKARVFEKLSHDKDFDRISRSYGWRYQIFRVPQKIRIAILVSKTDHCLYELLLKLKDKYLDAELCCILSNHRDLKEVAQQFGYPFHHVPVGRNKLRQETEIKKLLREYKVEAVVLARYMQILSPSFVREWRSNIINVHHGFLPAFKGKKPYHQAWRRGVKIIGATAHYVTEKLDEGPIVYQDVVTVAKNLSINEFIEKGKDIERKVLVEGLKFHLERKVFVHEGRTIIL